MTKTDEQKKELTPAQRRAIAALLTERDTQSAAEVAKVGYSTLGRWLKLPAFRAALSAAEGELLDEHRLRFQAMLDPARMVTGIIMADKANPPSVRLRAAEMVLDHYLKLREMQNFEERLAALEAAIHGKS